MSEQDRKNIATVISSILISSTRKMTIQQLNTEFQQHEGHRIPHEKFGCSNLEQFLRTLNDKVQVCGSGMHAEVQVIVGPKAAHINDLVSKQRVPNNKKSSRSANNRYRQPVSRRISNYNTNSISPLYPSTCAIRPLMSLKLQYTPITLTTTTVSQLGTTAFQYTTPSILTPTQTGSPDSCDKTAVLKSAMNSNKNSASNIYFINENPRNDKVPQFIQDNLRKIITNHPQGILCTNLHKTYKKYYCKTLNYSEYGYRSMAQMCVDLRDIFHVVQINESEIKLFDKRNPKPQDINKTKKLQSMNIKASTETPTENALPQADIKDMAKICFEEVPPNVLEYGGRLEQQWIDPGTNEQDYLDVRIGEVHNPSKFYINLKPYLIELNNLKSKMQMYYAVHRMEHLVPYDVLKDGLFVVCLFWKEYHRARIIDASRKDDGVLKVHIVDYGTIGMVSVQGVFYLHNQFTKLPEQGIKARLAGIRPSTENEQWSMGATSRFLSLVAEKDLIAQLIRIDEENRILDIILVDTTNDDDFFINEALVLLNYAILTLPVNAESDDRMSELQNCTNLSESVMQTSPDLKRTDTSHSNKKRQLTPKELKRIFMEKCK